MKTVQGTTRSYQLVQKTKRRDVDGIIYLVAGEKDIWVKILKDKSAQKEQEVLEQIANGYGAMFDNPLEIVRDSSGFLGYAFQGEEMDVIPVQEEKKKKSRKMPEETLEKESKKRSQKQKREEEIFTQQEYSPNTGNKTIMIVLILWGLVLFAANFLGLNTGIWANMIAYAGTSIASGCDVLSLHGILPSLCGGVVAFKILKRVLEHSFPAGVLLVIETVIFLGSVFIVDVIIAFIVIAVLAVLGTVQEYMGVIIVIGAIIFMVKGLLKK